MSFYFSYKANCIVIQFVHKAFHKNVNVFAFL